MTTPYPPTAELSRTAAAKLNLTLHIRGRRPDGFHDLDSLVARIGYTPFFICLGVLDLVGAVVLWTVVREPRVGFTPVPAAR